MSKKVFIESGIFYSFVNRAHPKHPQSAAYFRYFALQKFHVFSSYPVIEDVYKEIFEKMSPSLARDFLKGMSLSSINLLYPNESDFRVALKTLINSQNNEVGFRESQTGVLCNKNNIPQIATFDYLHPLFGLSTFNLPL